MSLFSYIALKRTATFSFTAWPASSRYALVVSRSHLPKFHIRRNPATGRGMAGVPPYPDPDDYVKKISGRPRFVGIRADRPGIALHLHFACSDSNVLVPFDECPGIVGLISDHIPIEVLTTDALVSSEIVAWLRWFNAPYREVVAAFCAGRRLPFGRRQARAMAPPMLSLLMNKPVVFHAHAAPKC